MHQVVIQEMVNFEFPKHYLPKVIAIIQSGALDLKNEKAVLHFDKDGSLRIIEYPRKFIPVNLTK